MLLPSHQRTLQVIRTYMEQHGYAPSIADIARLLGNRSKGPAFRYVQALKKAGYIHQIPGRAHGIELTEGLDVSSSLPLLGRIAAGRPIEAIADESVLNLGEMLLGPGRYALRVVGDSMIEAGILDGDTVIVRACDTACDGSIVVALIDHEEATLKRLGHKVDGSVLLIPENSSMPPMIYPAYRVAIQGVVVGQLRTY
ncbi:MAG TPA: repressor LexA [Gammaproteobacteria bacterium]|nr:repressor LexA [Gammaproteobacteria bacterium]